MNANPPYYAKFKQEWTVKALTERFEREDRALDTFGGVA